MSKILQIVLLLFVFGVVAAVPFLLANTVSTPSTTGAAIAVAPTQQVTVNLVGGVQEVTIRGDPSGYAPQFFSVKKGTPVKIKFSADKYAGCGRQLIMKDFGINLLAGEGQTVEATFTPLQEGSFSYRCSMNMFRGTMQVIA